MNNTQQAGETANPWPFNGYAPGNYMGICRECNKQMTGVDKLCFTCLECALSAVQKYISDLQKLDHAKVYDALKFLVGLKNHKDKEGETEFYKNMKQMAWQNAKEALVTPAPDAVEPIKEDIIRLLNALQTIDALGDNHLGDVARDALGTFSNKHPNYTS